MRSEVTCRELLTFLAEYLAGTLPPARREVFEGHLAACPECVAYINNYEAVIALAKRAGRGSGEPLPDEVPRELVRALVAARGERGSRS